MSVIRKGSRPKTCVPAPTVSDVSEPMVSDASEAPVVDVVANVVPPVRRKRPTKVVVPKEPELKEPEPKEPEPKEPEPKEPVKAKAPKPTKATKEPKAPKAPKVTKASKKATPEQEIPLLHKEVTLPTHQEMDMEEYSAEGFHIEYVPLSVFTHDGTTYFRDKRKNKLYQYGGPRRVGTYVGRYHPGREEIFTDLPDSDAEEP